jgi:tetratricopeptide (TPR) repeat protein
MRTLAVGLVACLTASAAWGQLGGSLGGSSGISGRTGIGGNPNTPSLGEPSSMGRGTFITGKVALSDGAALPEPAKIERYCSGTARVEAHTDLKGRFSFDLSRPQELADASDQPGALGRGRDRTLMDCELRISLPGFRTEAIQLSDSRLDNPDLGTIILRRIASVEGLTISATSSLAPKDAKKAYEKGLEAVGKKNVAEAQKDFEKAVEIYPRYAAAWYEIGRLDEQSNRFDEARKSYGQAVVADAKYIPPHERLAWIALRDTKWQELAEHSDTILRLDPIDYPDAYYLSGVGNFQLGNLDAAEKGAREALARDTTHKNPRTPYLLALILAQKHDYAAAVPLLRGFLEQNPGVSDAANIRQQLASMEEAARGQAPSSQEKAAPEKTSPEKAVQEKP